MHLNFQKFDLEVPAQKAPVVECASGNCTTQFVATKGAAWLWQDKTHIYRGLFCCDACMLEAVTPNVLARA